MRNGMIDGGLDLKVLFIGGRGTCPKFRRVMRWGHLDEASG